ncbi:hypothetical protein [Pseudorhodoplanes sinuspersici]|uniref:Uncharacterized protein n=1 Tax=Pseudorhodoplanes sinuspersici TaxID=1235591 RepID=A0A1W6ZSC2_9HYPH|nr:hypothetical protein [Pseudorhodoplanes sinuspersici]ARQ00262.1 hypothetical protein CAK95_15180 [Pseudorhodoplanes sinuspersici]RKE67583.1 hypothetical protein DFP91_5349 [Pseudorhodoplanes sinuspersici]
MANDLEIIESPLSGEFTRDGFTVLVEIYRLSDRDGWALEVADQDKIWTIWNELFDTDQAAFSEFTRTVEADGISAFLRPASEDLH